MIKIIIQVTDEHRASKGSTGKNSFSKNKNILKKKLLRNLHSNDLKLEQRQKPEIFEIYENGKNRHLHQLFLQEHPKTVQRERQSKIAIDKDVRVF